jgi:hypothetical protein
MRQHQGDVWLQGDNGSNFCLKVQMGIEINYKSKTIELNCGIQVVQTLFIQMKIDNLPRSAEGRSQLAHQHLQPHFQPGN